MVSQSSRKTSGRLKGTEGYDLGLASQINNFERRNGEQIPAYVRRANDLACRATKSQSIYPLNQTYYHKKGKAKPVRRWVSATKVHPILIRRCNSNTLTELKVVARLAKLNQQ